MKKILFLLLTALLPAVAGAYDAKIDGIYYNFNKDAKTATVTYYYNGSSNQNAYSVSVKRFVEIIFAVALNNLNRPTTVVTTTP